MQKSYWNQDGTKSDNLVKYEQILRQHWQKFVKKQSESTNMRTMGMDCS